MLLPASWKQLSLSASSTFKGCHTMQSHKHRCEIECVYMKRGGVILNGKICSNLQETAVSVKGVCVHPAVADSLKKHTQV